MNKNCRGRCAPGNLTSHIVFVPEIVCSGEIQTEEYYVPN